MKGLSVLMPKGKFVDPQQINQAIKLVHELAGRDGIQAVLAGGVAMQSYGSPRLTKDVDFVLTRQLSNLENLAYLGPINFGGSVYRMVDGTQIDMIVRNDEYKELYQHAIDNASISDEGVSIVTPEHLSAMKLAANEPKHILDLKWLLKQPGLVQIREVRNLIYKFVGGRFAQEAFDHILDEVELEKRRGGSSHGEYP